MELQRRSEIATLAHLYALREARRYPLQPKFLRSLLVHQEGVSPWAAASAIRALLKKRLAELEADHLGEDAVIITQSGIRWFEDHADYRRRGNVWSYRVAKGRVTFAGPRGKGFWGRVYNKYYELKHG